MKVKDILIRALLYAGREDAADELKKDGDGCAEVIQTALYCFNAVEDEVARNYFPLVREEDMLSITGEFPYTKFARTPTKILSVKAVGKDCEFTVRTDGVTSRPGKITVRYEHLPEKKGLDDDCEYYGEKANEKLFAAGTASELCLINGDVSQADYFEGVYRGELDALRAKGLAAFPPRRWV